MCVVLAVGEYTLMNSLYSALHISARGVIMAGPRCKCTVFRGKHVPVPHTLPDTEALWVYFQIQQQIDKLVHIWEQWLVLNNVC